MALLSRLSAFALLDFRSCPLFVRYSEVFRFWGCYAPCLFCRNPNAPSIASATLACAVWNI